MGAAEEFFAKSNEELRDALLDLKKEQLNLRFQKASGQLENTARMRVVRRNIARIKTILSTRDATGNPLPGAPVPGQKPTGRSRKAKQQPAVETTAAEQE